MRDTQVQILQKYVAWLKWALREHSEKCTDDEKAKKHENELKIAFVHHVEL